MAGEPAPLATVQAAVLKSAASKQAAQGNPALSTQADAVRQDLAVMADQAKGYSAGVSAGTIEAENQRAAQSRRIAIEKAQADAERARDQQLASMATEQTRLRGQADAAQYQRDVQDAKRDAAEKAAKEEEPDGYRRVALHAAVNRGPEFNKAFTDAISDPLAGSASDAMALFDARAARGEYADGLKREILKKYVEEYFRGMETNAVNLRSLDKKKKDGTRPPASAAAAASARPNPRPYHVPRTDLPGPAPLGGQSIPGQSYLDSLR